MEPVFGGYLIVSLVICIDEVVFHVFRRYIERLINPNLSEFWIQNRKEIIILTIIILYFFTCPTHFSTRLI